MINTVSEQVIVGKMSLPKANGQISLFSLPQSFAWFKHFTAEEMAEFFTELLEALNQSQQTGAWANVDEVIEAWKETANLKANQTVAEGVKKGLTELATGQGVSWIELKKDMGL